jgi:murein DD-endopeptidase MepM/ murein hydrolase activator NlpD
MKSGFKRRRLTGEAAAASMREQFGLPGPKQLGRDMKSILGQFGGVAPIDLTTARQFRPLIALPAYAGYVPESGVAPIMHLFDRTGGGKDFRHIATKRHQRDWRGGRLSYDEHDGVDFVCPPRMPVAAAAPGVVVATRRSFLRGGLTACVDHGAGVVTQYTHLTRMASEVGQPVRRGDLIAFSGSGGLDMVSGFPLVPPHVHFMTWVDGIPVDPYRRSDDPPIRVGWLEKNKARTSGPLKDDPKPIALDDVAVDEAALERVLNQCLDSTIAAELDAAGHPATQLAILEDSLHHDRKAWPEGLFGGKLRGGPAAEVRITMPLSAEDYHSAEPDDNDYTRPPEGWRDAV